MKHLNKKTAYLCLITFGFFGAHRFYCEKRASAWLMLVNGLLCMVAFSFFLFNIDLYLAVSSLAATPAGLDNLGGLGNLEKLITMSSALDFGHINMGSEHQTQILVSTIIYNITGLIGTAWVLYDFFHLSRLLHSGEQKSKNSLHNKLRTKRRTRAESTTHRQEINNLEQTLDQTVAEYRRNKYRKAKNYTQQSDSSDNYHGGLKEKFFLGR